MRIWRLVETGSLTLGLCLLVAFAAAQTHRAVLQESDLARFEEVRRALDADPSQPAGSAADLAKVLPVDFALWSESRVRHYRESLGAAPGLALGVLRIPSISLEVAVRQGTDDLTLNRAVGWIPGTARPGEDGNVGLAGHRDGFFRGLKDVQAGTTIQVVTLERTDVYVVESLEIVDPTAVEVLAATEHPTLTLVTCYPFYHLGHAPKRFIVRARLERSLN